VGDRVAIRRDLPPEATAEVACLDTGGVATEGSAGWLHGLGRLSAPSRPVVLVLRPGGDHHSPLAEVRTTNWLPSHDTLEVDGIPCLSVARTLFSLAAVQVDGGVLLRDLVDEAVRDPEGDRRVARPHGRAGW
jgi:hypothetical protein